MDAKDQLLKSRAALAAILDRKLKNVPEWQAYRAVEAALNAFLTGAEVSEPQRRQRARPSESVESYADLALKALGQAGKPLTTPEIVAFVARHRQLPDVPEKAKLNIGSGLSRDERVRSIAWQGGRAWWHADRPPPEHRSAAE